MYRNIESTSENVPKSTGKLILDKCWFYIPYENKIGKYANIFKRESARFEDFV
jgi:hypothetical protein